MRWVWAATAEIYPALLRAGVRVRRCHDVELTEALLLGPRRPLGRAARAGRGLGPADRRARCRPTRRRASPTRRASAQGALFETGPAPSAAAGFDSLERPDQGVRRPARVGAPRPSIPGRFRLLVAAESAGRADRRRDGPRRPAVAGRHPRRAAARAARPAAAGRAAAPARRAGRPGQRGVRRARPAPRLARPRCCARSPGPASTCPNTRAWVLRKVDHPAVPPLLEYKELYRIWTAHGWAWRDAWVRDGRFRPEYVPGGVVSGRWATRGGGALQVPKVVRRAVVADPGWRFVVADAGQLEPRVLAAVSGDARLAAAGARRRPLRRAGRRLLRRRPRPGQGRPARRHVRPDRRRRDPRPGRAAAELPDRVRVRRVRRPHRRGRRTGPVLAGPHLPARVHRLARRRAGAARGGRLGRAPQGGATGRARGRFTRNFVIQATAAEWALVLLATLRTALEGTKAELVFFVHDEVVVHCPSEQADAVVAAVQASAAEAGRLLFGETAVRFPLDVSVVECYADAA